MVLRKRQSHRVSTNSSRSPQRCGGWRGSSTLPLYCLTSLTHTLTARWLRQHTFKTCTCSSPGRPAGKNRPALWLGARCRWHCTGKLRCKFIAHQLFSAAAYKQGLVPEKTQGVTLHTGYRLRHPAHPQLGCSCLPPARATHPQTFKRGTEGH